MLPPDSPRRACQDPGTGLGQGHSETALQEILTLNSLTLLPLPANNVSPPAADVLRASPLPNVN